MHNWSDEGAFGGVWMFNQYEYLKDEVDLYFLDGMRNPISFIRHFFKLRKVARNYDLVHAQYGSANGFLASFVTCKRILSLKGSDWYISPSSSILHKLRVKIGTLLTKISLPRFDHIIVMSNAMKEQVLVKFPKATVTTIVDPIDLNRFIPLNSEKRNDKKKVLFAAVNLNNPIKRFALAKKSFELLKNKMPNAELVTMTKIPHTEVNGFMNQVDVLLLTSVYEGWPNVVKEMLALNKPFVSTKVSDLEQVAAKTESCFVCNDNPKELSESLYKSLNLPSENLRWLVEDFRMDDTIVSIRKIYSSYLK